MELCCSAPLTRNPRNNVTDRTGRVVCRGCQRLNDCMFHATIRNSPLPSLSLPAGLPSLPHHQQQGHALPGSALFTPPLPLPLSPPSHRLKGKALSPSLARHHPFACCRRPPSHCPPPSGHASTRGPADVARAASHCQRLCRPSASWQAGDVAGCARAVCAATNG